MFLSFMAGASALMAMLLLFFCWQFRPKFKSTILLFCWLIILVSPWLWHDGSVELAVVYVALTVCSCAWLLSIKSTLKSKASVLKKGSTQGAVSYRRTTVLKGKPIYKVRNISKHVVNLLLVLPFAGVGAMLVSMSLFGFIGIDTVNVMALSALTMPLLWGVFGFWTISSRRKAKPIVLLSMLAGISALSLFWS
tara:strand:- start:617 stop:1198 length:582 start_codon:yes stop_codon:yes gene_type:complete